LQAQWPEVVFRQLAGKIALRLAAELGDALVDESLVEIVVAVHTATIRATEIMKRNQLLSGYSMPSYNQADGTASVGSVCAWGARSALGRAVRAPARISPGKAALITRCAGVPRLPPAGSNDRRPDGLHSKAQSGSGSCRCSSAAVDTYATIFPNNWRLSVVAVPHVQIEVAQAAGEADPVLEALAAFALMGID
jgi:hypothetical protein